jgi:hypothetical protein
MERFMDTPCSGGSQKENKKFGELRRCITQIYTGKNIVNKNEHIVNRLFVPNQVIPRCGILLQN